MTSRKEDTSFAMPPKKKLRFRGDLNLHHFDGRIEDLLDDADKRSFVGGVGAAAAAEEHLLKEKPSSATNHNTEKSFLDFLQIEITRGYVLDHDEERYSARLQKIYTFMKIPRELEKFMVYGVLQCVDSFLYIHTFLLIRYVMAVCALVWRPIATCFGWRRRGQRILSPAEICDLLKGSIWLIAAIIIISIDTNRIYHIIKSQSVIKLYIFYNMLEVGDRLLSAFGQDTIDALFWTATEPKERHKRGNLGIVMHIVFALVYIILHSGLIMLQATTLNVAINSNNKGLLGIMMSNNFVELKGSVFKKFDKNNLFQLTCSDVRERVHLSVLLIVVVIQTMKEFNWRADQFYVLLPDCICVLVVEVLIDWLKHAFITRFNELPSEVYKEYTISLAYDMTQTRQKHAFSDHSDLVSRRMGFIPYPLSIVLIKAVYTAVSFDNVAAIVLFIVAYIAIFSCRVLNTICCLGKACNLMRNHQTAKHTQLMTTPTTTVGGILSGHPVMSSMNGVSPLAPTTIKIRPASHTTDTASSPVHSFFPLQRSQTVEIVTQPLGAVQPQHLSPDKENDLLSFGATALFSNSDVDLDDICLNEHLLNAASGGGGGGDTFDEHVMTRSVPDLQQESTPSISVGIGEPYLRTHKRSESDPFIQSAHLDMPQSDRS